MTPQDVVDGVEDWAEENGVPVNQVIYTIQTDVKTGVLLDYSYRRMTWWEALDAGAIEGVKAGDGVFLMGNTSGWEPGDDYLEWGEIQL